MKNIPIISFIHKDIDGLISSKIEIENQKREKLERFKELVQKKLCKFWSSPQDLGAVVSRSISQAKKNYPRIGWVRADTISVTSEKEIIQLYKKIEQLEKQLESAKSIESKEVENLADGKDVINIRVTIAEGYHENRKEIRNDLNFTWDEFSFIILPKILNAINEKTLRLHVRNAIKEIYQTKFDIRLTHYSTFTTNLDFYETYKIQMQLLGYINFYEEKNELDKINKFAVLTEKGRDKLVKLRAVSKELTSNN